MAPHAVRDGRRRRRDAYSPAAFEAAQKAGKPILIHITAPWCTTCAAQKPILAKLEADPRFKDLQVFDVDFDSRKDVVKRFGATRHPVARGGDALARPDDGGGQRAEMGYGPPFADTISSTERGGRALGRSLNGLRFRCPDWANVRSGRPSIYTSLPAVCTTRSGH